MTTNCYNKVIKKNKLRYNEYYDLQEVFDKLYDRSKKQFKFNRLYEIITDERNILLAYRNIKRNTGSYTKGTNNKTIKDLEVLSSEEIIELVRNKLSNYKPGKVRRVFIPKSNGKSRPLGIPTIEDRLIQQCIKQVLEPICEAKFHPHSYGFRPNRNTGHALARTNYLINKGKKYYVVDIDIKGFFDNVNHGKLIKQMWTLGIRDKRVLSIISKMLKAEIEGEGIPTKGTPQGGILSPLLSNIVLNELDWWISDQWETFETRKDYTIIRKTGQIDQSNRYRAMKDTTNLKEVWIVRYADDFKLLCPSYKIANIMFKATKQWLKERLGLEISKEKSKVINLKKNYSEFLGFKFKLTQKGKNLYLKSHMTDKAITNVHNKLKERIKEIKRKPGVGTAYAFNSTVLGMHQYYKQASLVNIDFGQIWSRIRVYMNNSLKKVSTHTGTKTKTFEKLYGGYNYNVYVSKVPLYPIYGVKVSMTKNFNQQVCNYTDIGRMLVHMELSKDYSSTLRYLLKNGSDNNTVEFNDNKISLFVGQRGLCGITKTPLTIGDMEVHHIIPKHLGGTDEYANLIFINSSVHKLIHATTPSTIDKYYNKISKYLDKNSIKKLNTLRTKVGNNII